MDRPEKSGGIYMLIENSEQRVEFENSEQVEFAGNQVEFGVTVKSRSPVLPVRILLFG